MRDESSKKSNPNGRRTQKSAHKRTCKNRRRYSRERAPRSLGGKFNSPFTSLPLRLTVRSSAEDLQNARTRAVRVHGHITDLAAIYEEQAHFLCDQEIERLKDAGLE